MADLGRARARGEVKITRLPDGKWRAVLIDELGEPVTFKDFTTQKDAQRWARETGSARTRWPEPGVRETVRGENLLRVAPSSVRGGRVARRAI